MKKEIVNSIINYIEDSLEVFRVDIDCLVKYSGYSRRQLQIIFREYAGLPLGEYIRLRRICRGACLLRLTMLPLSEISNRLFYDSQQSFQREFKKNTGVTPLKYRKQNMWGGGVAKLNTNLHYELSYQGVCFLESIEFSGRNIKYKDVIPYYGFCSGLKWDIISNWIEKSEEPIIMAYDIKLCLKPHNHVLIDSWIYMDKKELSEKKIINGGWYCLFNYTGSKESYQQAISTLYVHFLSPRNLSRRVGYDIEVIQKKHDDTYSIEYFLPIALCPQGEDVDLFVR